MPADWFYEPCARCGDLAGRFAHMMAATQRLICGRCWRDLKFDAQGHKVDDLVVPQLSTPARDVDNRTSGKQDDV